MNIDRVQRKELAGMRACGPAERSRLKRFRQEFRETEKKKMESFIRGARNKTISASDKGKEDAKARHLKCVEKNVKATDAQQYRTNKRPKKSK
jgi:hypothetical protein